MLRPYLKAEADRLRRRVQEAPNNPPPVEPMTPLAARVAKLLATIPPEVARLGVPIVAIQERLTGRQPGKKARIGDVATALRVCGWVRTRCWRKSASGFTARWYPPKTL